MTDGGNSHWRRVRQVFEEASESESSERTGLIAARCAGDGALRRDVEELLALRKEPSLVMDRPPVSSIDQQNLAAAARAAADSQQGAARYSSGTLIGGRYRIVRFLGHGGMGEVYEAVDQNESRTVALKFVRHLPGHQGQLEARFLREVRLARKIEHPNVCHVFDVAEHAGERFCTMELLHGETLAVKLARDGRFPPGQALPIAVQLCEGVAAAHRAGVLHRDLKPGNVVLMDGRATIIDFGLAAAAVRDGATADVSLTATGAMMGTLAYMAPEQLEEGGGGVPADLYSLGVILYEMLTGEKPHDAKSPFRLAAQKAREAHRTPDSDGLSSMPAVWREVITRSLKARPKDRYASAEAMRRALERGHPSAGFVLSQRRVFVPALTSVACLMAWAGSQWERRDHVAPPQAARLYQQAVEAMTTAAPVRAVKFLEQAVDLDAKFVNARSLLAVAHSETDQIDKAKDTLLQVIAAKDKRWFLGRGEALALDAANAAVLNDFTGAAERYRRLSTLPGYRDFALLSRARMLAQAGRTDEAIRTLEKAIAAPGGSSNPAARVRLASLLSSKGEYAKAAAEFNRAEAVYQKTGNLEGLCDLWIARALVLRTQSGAEDRADLDRAIHLSAKTGNRYQNLMARLRMALVAQRERDYDGAIAVQREVAEEAQRDGMLALAARAIADLGYVHMILRRNEEAVVILRQSVELAERAKSYRALAANRIRLGECLGSLGRNEEALAALQPAVQWYRHAGPYDTLLLALLKWGTVLAATNRFGEAEPVFREVYSLSEKNGEDGYRTMALQRLAGFEGPRNLRRSVDYWDQAVALVRRTQITYTYFQAAGAWSRLGGFDKAQRLIAEGQREAVENYSIGPDQAFLLDSATEKQAFLQYKQGHCDQAIAELRKLNHAGGLSDRLLRRARACGSHPSSLGSDLAWFEEKIVESATKSLDDQVSSMSVDAGDLALRLKDWYAARRHALRGIDASRAKGLRAQELENTMVLRAAEARLGHRSEVKQLTARVLDLEREVGFEKPGEFGGLQDLLYFWRLGDVTQARNRTD